MSLNQFQQNAVATTLLQLEQSLNDIERLLDSRNSPSVTYLTEVGIAPATAQQIGEKCEELREQIAEMVTFFELPRHHWSGRQIIAAEMTSAWINLEEINPNRLHRYGAVDPTLAETLTPRLERLAQLVRAMQNLASGGE